MSRLYQISRRQLFRSRFDPIQDIAHGTGKRVVLCPGLYRAGTASLSLALNHLGVGPVWHLVTNSSEQRENLNWFLEEDRYARLLKEDRDVNLADFMIHCGCPVLMHFPFGALWKETLMRYPQAAVIVCYREFDEWYESMQTVMSMVYSPQFMVAVNGTYMMDIPGMLDRWTDRDYWRYNEFKDEMREKHYDGFLKDIEEFVPKEQLLMYDVRDGWEPICSFLGLPPPDPYIDFPHVNTRDMLETAFESAKAEKIKFIQ